MSHLVSIQKTVNSKGFGTLCQESGQKPSICFVLSEGQIHDGPKPLLLKQGRLWYGHKRKQAHKSCSSGPLTSSSAPPPRSRQAGAQNVVLSPERGGRCCALVCLVLLQTGKTKEAPISRKSFWNLERKQKWKFFIPTNLRDFSLKRSGLPRTKCYQKQS